jgi:cytochrome P450 family 135
MLPPGPRAPRVMQSLSFGGRPVEFLDRCEARYGDAFTIRLAHEPPWVVLSDPAAITQVFRADPEVARAGEANTFLRPVLGPQSVLLLDASEHIARRRLTLPPLHGDRLRGYEPIMRDAVAAEVGTWRPGEQRRVIESMRAITLEVILRAIFGITDAARLAEARTRVNRLTAFSTQPSSMLGILAFGYGAAARNPRLHALRRPVHELIDDEVARRRADPGDDVLSRLIAAGLGDTALRDELLTMLIAGHETTATALAWAVDLALHDPALRGDVDAMVERSLRDRPVVPIVVRRLVAPLEIGGLDLPAGVNVAPCPLLAHRRRDAPTIAFGGGTRRCLGAAFALYEMRVVLDELFARVKLEPARRELEGVTRRAQTLAPRYGVEVRVLG